MPEKDSASAEPSRPDREAMPIALLRRGVRALRYGWRALRSAALLAGYRLQYSGLVAGRNVRLGRGTYINVASGGRLVLGDNVVIDSNVHLTADGGSIEIGRDSYVGIGAVIVAAERISIGADALIAAYATIRDQDHGHEPGTPYHAQPLITAPVTIGHNVWLGTHVTVVKGVSIGSGSIVGANSVVTRDVPSLSLSAGAPARTIRAIGAPDDEGPY
jgi:acetyltransferase-like isoleucine patch superfamily enzyme